MLPVVLMGMIGLVLVIETAIFVIHFDLRDRLPANRKSKAASEHIGTQTRDRAWRNAVPLTTGLD